MNATAMKSAESSRCFELNPRLSPDQLGAALRSNHRLRVPDFLNSEGALALYRHLVHDVEWRVFFAANGNLHGARADLRGVYSEELDRKMLDLAYQHSRNEFAYIHEVDRLFPEDTPEGVESGGAPETTLMARFAEFLNTPAVLQWIRCITGRKAIVRADVQATRHRMGHFANYSTGPSSQEGIGRVEAAVVLNLTPEWQVEWGGLLEFQAQESYVIEGYVPSFNVLDIFLLPQGHWLSPVAAFAGESRLAIAGRFYASIEGK